MTSKDMAASAFFLLEASQNEITAPGVVSRERAAMIMGVLALTAAIQELKEVMIHAKPI